MKKIGLNIVILGGIFFCLLSGAELRAEAEFSQFGSLLGDYFIKYYRSLASFQEDNLYIQKIHTANSILDAINNKGYEVKFNTDNTRWITWQNVGEAKRRVEEARGKERGAEPETQIKGTNPDGSTFYQFGDDRLDIFGKWIDDKIKEMGLADQWKGESFDTLVKMHPNSGFSLTFNKDSDVYIGNNSVMQQKTVFQFSIINEDQLDEYIQSRTIQNIWDSINGKESETVQHSITDGMAYSDGSKFYSAELDDGTVVSRRQLISFHQRTWNETLKTYSESTQTNDYIDNTDRAVKTTRHVVDKAFDGLWEQVLYRREYDVTRENITYIWVASGDPVTDGSWQLKSFDQTTVDYSSLDKTTFSHHEFTYNQETGLADSQLIVTRETNADGTLDSIYTTVEKYLDYYKDGQASKQLTFTLEGSADLDMAIKEGKALQSAIMDKLNALDSGLDSTSVDGLKTYAGYVSKVMELVGEGKTVDTALEEVIASGGEGLSDITGRRINITYSEKKYNDKGFLGWESDITAVRGTDEDGTKLDYSQKVEKTYKAFTPFGQPTKIEEIVWSEMTPDVQTTVEITLEYNVDCTVKEQRTETWEKGLNGKDFARHTVTVKDNISYDGTGREESYDEEETEYNTSGEIIGHAIREFSDIAYNEDGLQESYRVKTTVKGTDTHDDEEFASVTETDVTDIEYNNLGIRTSWKQATVNAATPDLTTETEYTVTATDEFGRITEMEIAEHSYGEADGTELDIETTTRRVVSYNSLGQEEKVYEETVEGEKTTENTITNEYDEYGRLSKETRKIHVTGEDGDTKLDYESTITRTDFEYNNAGMVQHYASTIENESTPDLKITEEVWLGYNDAGQVDYQKTELHEEGTDNETDKDGALTGETEEVNRITISIESDIKYNTLGLRTSWVSEETVKEGGELVTDIKQTYSDIKYDDQGRMIEYTIKVTGKQSSKDEDTGKYGELQDADYSIHYYNVKYNELGMKISWDQSTGSDGSSSQTQHWEVTYNEYGEITDVNKTGDGVEEEDEEEENGDNSDGEEGSSKSQGISSQSSSTGKTVKKRKRASALGLVQEEHEEATRPFDGKQEEKASAEEVSAKVNAEETNVKLVNNTEEENDGDINANNVSDLRSE